MMKRGWVTMTAFLALFGLSAAAWAQDEKKFKPEEEEEQELTPQEAMKLLHDAKDLMLKSEELLNDSSRGKALETEEELIKKLEQLLKEEQKGDPSILQKKVLEKIEKLLEKTGKKQKDTADKLGEIIRRAKT